MPMKGFAVGGAPGSGIHGPGLAGEARHSQPPYSGRPTGFLLQLVATAVPLRSELLTDTDDTTEGETRRASTLTLQRKQRRRPLARSASTYDGSHPVMRTMLSDIARSLLPRLVAFPPVVRACADLPMASSRRIRSDGRPAPVSPLGLGRRATRA